MLMLKADNDNAIIVLHEIYGINDHIKRMCDIYHESGFDIFCPDLLRRDTHFLYEQHEQAYNYFKNNCGFNTTAVEQLVNELKEKYKKVIIIGFSVGATLSWLCSETSQCDGVVSFYGSRIRDYIDVMPRCPTLVIQAKYEQAYTPSHLQQKLASKPMMSFYIFNGRHGFCDRFSPSFNEEESKKAMKLSFDFITKIVG
ncbi:dienelactone hydrolase family protein [Salmonella enterica]|nr:dienelactone hydrolase family protein [Salmonella enterica]